MNKVTVNRKDKALTKIEVSKIFALKTSEIFKSYWCLPIRKFAKVTRKYLCQSLYFNKVTPATLLKQRLQHKCFLPWLITTSCLTSQFQISCRTSETLGRGSRYPAEGLSLDLKISLHFLGRGFWVQISGRRFYQIWFLN